MIRLLVYLSTAASFLFTSFNSFAVDEARLQAVEASVQIQESPPQIRLTWPSPETGASRYRIAKRPVGGGWSDVATLDGSATSWTDGSVSAGQRYEYRIIKDMPNGYMGHSYLMAGIRAPILEDTGKVLLIVRDNIASSAGGELEQLRQDLIREGWEVLRQDVNEGASPQQIRSIIQSAYGNSGGALKHVMLLGHVTVPYSGNIMPDGHGNHQGAWPADGYYADMDGNWTDSSVFTRTAERQANWNVAGDGKFDQGQYPATLKVGVGRIDFYQMTCYANKANARSEIDLTRQYLNKDHAFRSGQWQVSPRGVILDNFGLRDTNGVSASAWANFAGFFGASANSKIDLNTYFSRLQSESALWSWTAGGGSYYYSSGVGTSDDFALTDINVVFSLSLGSYFGDWNNESNWLKAALGSGKVLVSVYAGIPRTFFHPMALGGTIGESFLLTQNNGFGDDYLPDTQGTHEVHQALLGDPTLRMWPRGSVNNLSGTGGAGQATLNWSAPGDRNNYLGAHIYRGASPNGPFNRVTTSPVASSYTDTVAAGSYSYLVRPVFLESNGSGSFYNLGQGAITANLTVTEGTGGGDPGGGGGGGGGGGDPTPTNNPPKLAIRKISGSTIGLSITADANKSVIVETNDGTSWNQLGTITATGSAQEFELGIDAIKLKIYRARY